QGRGLDVKEVAKPFMCDLMEALTFLAYRNIAHRDVKPENLLVDNTHSGLDRLVLTDFGAACFTHEMAELQFFNSTYGYSSPEMLLLKGTGCQDDVFSAGCVFFFMVCRRSPFAASKVEEIRENTLCGSWDEANPSLQAGGAPLKDFLRKALCVVDARMSSHDALLHPCLNNNIPVLQFEPAHLNAYPCPNLFRTAAIDNVTRQLLRRGQRPVSVGFWFALGHSSVVLTMTALLAAGYSAAVNAGSDNLGVSEKLSLAAAATSVALLCGLGLLNAKIAIGLFHTWSGIRNHEAGQQDKLTEDHAQAALRSAVTMLPCVEWILKNVNRPEKMVLVGLLFGLSFDTATQVSLIGLSAMSGTSGNLPPLVVMLFPICFSCGMCLVDTLNGLLMLMTYSWATVRPIQKLFYNFVVTAMSACVALLISSLELLQILGTEAGWKGPFWIWVQGVNMGTLGFAVIVSFAMVFTAAVCENAGNWEHVPGPWLSAQLVGVFRSRRFSQAAVNGAMLGALSVGRWEHAFALLSSAVLFGMVPDSTSFGALIAASEQRDTGGMETFLLQGMAQHVASDSAQDVASAAGGSRIPRSVGSALSVPPSVQRRGSSLAGLLSSRPGSTQKKCSKSLRA
ncbi:unnamed protein product, partial [Polarella glacialis]